MTPSRSTQNTRKTGLNVFENLHHLNCAITLLGSMEKTLNGLTTTQPCLVCHGDPILQTSLEKLGDLVTRTLETLQKIHQRTQLVMLQRK